MAKQKQHRRQKGEVKFSGATFKLNEPGKFVRGELKPKPSQTRKEKAEFQY